jgi:hypothetical protein
LLSAIAAHVFALKRDANLLSFASDAKMWLNAQEGLWLRSGRILGF